MKVIANEEDLVTATAALCTQHPVFGEVLKQTGPLPLRRAPGGFSGLLKILVGQQVSTASAAAIWKRVIGAGLDDRKNFIAAADAEILAIGFSRPKLRYGRAIANSALNFQALRDVPDVEVERQLTGILGIGPWTAQIYLLSCLGRVDVFPNADLALQESAKILLGLDARPTAKEMAKIAAAWSPHQSVAARALWAYYRIIKGREGLA